MNDVYSMSMPIGYTASGLPVPVFYDPHYAIRINKPPVTLITGSPGSGKTFAALLFASHAALLNKITFVLDPKDDFTSLINLQRAGEIENVKVWSIFSQGEVREENIGMLDPTCLTDDMHENASLTLQTISTLSSGLTPKQRNAIIPIIQDVTQSENPSMRTIVTLLARSRDEDISSLSHELNMALSMPAGRLLVASSKQRQRFNFKSGLVVASLLGLSLPPSSKSEDTYLDKEKLAVSIMRLLTHLVLDIMKKVPSSINKLLIIDEAWAVFNNEAGRSLIDEVALLGRTLNMATILATQSPSHIKAAKGQSSLENTISTRFAFRNNSDEDNNINVKEMGLPMDHGYQSTFKEFTPGMCLMKDSQEQFQFVDITLPKDWIKMLSTTPTPD